MNARTKLVCTLGPASATPKMVRGLVEAGASVFRINCSHGTADDHARGVSIVREVEEATGRSLAVLADLPGPKVRLADVHPDPFPFRPGQRFELRPGGPGDAAGAATTYPGLADDLRAGTASCSPTAPWSSRSSGSRATSCRPSASARGRSAATRV